jgi:translocation and assembly module TamB
VAYGFKQPNSGAMGGEAEPLLDIVGVYKAKDLLVTASLVGPARTVKLALSTDPVMPQDEILSRVLFDKAQGKLSAMEAVQLASAAAELNGKGGGLDVVGSFRRSLGIDVLRVDGGAAEIELTPYLKVTSESTEVDNKAGLQFKWDYWQDTPFP